MVSIILKLSLLSFLILNVLAVPSTNATMNDDFEQQIKINKFWIKTHGIVAPFYMKDSQDPATHIVAHTANYSLLEDLDGDDLRKSVIKNQALLMNFRYFKHLYNFDTNQATLYYKWIQDTFLTQNINTHNWTLHSMMPPPQRGLKLIRKINSETQKQTSQIQAPKPLRTKKFSKTLSHLTNKTKTQQITDRLDEQEQNLKKNVPRNANSSR